jgi:hypothetical protein
VTYPLVWQNLAPRSISERWEPSWLSAALETNLPQPKGARAFGHSAVWEADCIVLRCIKRVGQGWCSPCTTTSKRCCASPSWLNLCQSCTPNEA